MKGGLILTDLRLTGFTPVIEMIKNGKITILSNRSRSGIIFKLLVRDEHSYYTNFNKNGEKIKQFIIKLAIITSSKTQYTLIGEDKITETNDSFLQEARIQQDIWIKTNQYGGQEFVPGIANFAFFDNVNSQILLDYMSSSFRYNEVSDSESNDESSDEDDEDNLFMRLIRIITTTPESNIGVIVMDYVDSITLNRAEQRYGTKVLQEIYKKTIFNILRLYLFYGIINWDLTTTNILITIGVPMNVYLIDFGRVSSINEPRADHFLNEEDKRVIFHQKETYIQSIRSVIDKYGFIYTICTYISDLEKTLTQKNSRASKKNDTYQMDWIKDFFSLPEENKNKICSDIFDLLMSDIIRINHLDPRVTSLVMDGSIMYFDLSKPVFAYYVHISPPLRHKGGKKIKILKKIKKTKRYKKFKKHRKTRRYKTSKRSNKY